jgi:Raf kinase inhibitor-like YbhB/YbcL family protein
MAFELKSQAFQSGDRIPTKYTCEGADVSPPLRWNDPPSGTRSIVLIADDPDAPAGVWVHWVIFNLPENQRDLQEGVPTQETFPNGARQGLNDFLNVGYGGPCPPPGKPHRYYFKLYALDGMLDLKPCATKAKVLEACKGHILAEAQLMGQFGR